MDLTEEKSLCDQLEESGLEGRHVTGWTDGKSFTIPGDSPSPPTSDYGDSTSTERKASPRPQPDTQRPSSSNPEKLVLVKPGARPEDEKKSASSPAKNCSRNKSYESVSTHYSISAQRQPPGTQIEVEQRNCDSSPSIPNASKHTAPPSLTGHKIREGGRDKLDNSVPSHDYDDHEDDDDHDVDSCSGMEPHMFGQPGGSSEEDDDFDSYVANLLPKDKDSSEESEVDLSELDRIKADIESGGEDEAAEDRGEKELGDKAEDSQEGNESERWNRIVKLVKQMKTLMIKYPKFTSRAGTDNVVSALHAMMDSLEARGDGGEQPSSRDIQMVEEQMEDLKAALLKGIDDDLTRWRAQRESRKKFAIKALALFFVIMGITSYYSQGGRGFRF